MTRIARCGGGDEIDLIALDHPAGDIPRGIGLELGGRKRLHAAHQLARAPVGETSRIHGAKPAEPVSSPTLNDLIPEAKFKHGAWVGSRLNIFAFAYNPTLVKKEELPKSYEEFLDRKEWAGRIALDDLVEQGFDTLINHKDTAVKVLVHP